MESWIPVLVAVISLCIALLKHYGKVKHADALALVVSAIENADKEGVIKRLVMRTSLGTRAEPIIDKMVRKIGG